LNIVVARSYQADLSGWINFISNNFALILIFGSISLDVSILYFGAAEKIKESKLAFFAMTWSVLVSLLFYFCISLFISESALIQSKGLLKFAAINYFVGIIITNFFFNLFIIQEEFLIPNVLLSLINIMLIGTIPGSPLALHIFDKETFIYFYYFAFSLQGIILIIAYFIYQKKIEVGLPNKAELRQLFKYAGIAFLANLVFFLVCRIDYWFINYYRNNATELGNYIQASKLGQMLLVFSMIIASTVLPQTASGKTSVVVEKLLKIIRNFIVFFSLLLLALLLTGKNIMTYVFGPTFDLMFWPMIYLLPGIFSLSVLTIFSAYFGGIDKTIVNLKSAFVGLVLITIFDFFMIAPYGINAAAIGSSIGYFAAMCYSLYCFHKINPVKMSQIIQIRLSDFYWIPKLFKTNK
jgi:O-antigen/teichoic acid export membrane protein